MSDSTNFARSSDIPPSGSGFAMAMLACLIVCLGSACSPQPKSQVSRLREWRTWQLPPEGPSLPTPRSLAVGPKDELVVLDTAGRVTIYDSAGVLLRQWHMLDVS